MIVKCNDQSMRIKNPYGHISLKVLNVQFDFNVSVDTPQTYIKNLISHLHIAIMTHNFDFDTRF